MAAGLAAALGTVSGEPAASPEYRKDPAVRAAVERELKTSDPAEIRRRWGVLVDLLDTPWTAYNETTKYRHWFHARWVVQGAVIELVRGSCEDKKCTIRKALLVHNPQLSKRSLWPNPYGVPAFDMLWEDGRGEALGMVYKDKDLVQTNTTSYRFSSGSGEARIDGQPYKPMPAAELAALTGYEFKAGPTQAAAAQPASQPAAPPSAPNAHDRPALKPVAEAVFVCTRPDSTGSFSCDAPDRTGLRGESPQASLAGAAQSCPSQRRLPSRTHFVWGCGFGATNAPGAMDRSAGVEMRGRGTYHCSEREASCKRTEPL